MSILVYRRASSSGARELSEALGARRVRGRVPLEQRTRTGDYVVCWGETHQPINGVRLLNNGIIRSKYADAIALTAAHVSTIEVSPVLPRLVPVVVTDPIHAIFAEVSEMAADFGELERASRERPFRDGLVELQNALGRLNTALGTPPPVARPAANLEWLGRLNDHSGGSDLLNPPETPNYWVKKIDLVREYRIHSFMEKSIRAGIKILRDGYVLGPPGQGNGMVAHPWIRTFEAGWRISYDGISSKKAHRELAHNAVKSLGLDFGAVDIGEKADGTLVVLEVNRAPGIEGGTVEMYAKAIQGWVEATR